MKQVWNWKNGYKDGLQTYWYENGQLFYEGMFVDGRKEGKWTWWYKDGTKEMEKVHKKGKPDGLWRWWNESGELMKSGTYVEEKKQGMWNYYYDKGQKYFEDIERQIREGGGHWNWIDESYGTDEESGKGGERDQNKPFVTTRKKWRPRAERTA
jgi:antitoxin component YwqK of YwqJK toxin-antitoxin module